MTRIEISYAGQDTELSVELRGHDADEHCRVILAAWLKQSALDAEIDEEEDDAEDWEIAEFAVFSRHVCFMARPNRGEEAWFLFQPPEA